MLISFLDLVGPCYPNGMTPPAPHRNFTGKYGNIVAAHTPMLQYLPLGGTLKARQ